MTKGTTNRYDIISSGPLRTWLAAVNVEALRPRILFAFRLSTSVSLALFITYWLELQNSFWAATTAAIVCQPNLGASLQKGRYRIIGTIVGGLVMVGLLALFAQQRNTLIFSLALWCGLCGCAVVILRNYASYAAGLSGITATIIFADTISDPTTAFFIALTRVGEICIGIGATAFMVLLTENAAATQQLSKTLKGTANQLCLGFSETIHPEKTGVNHTALRHEMVRSLGLLRNQVDAAIGESSYLHSRRGNLNHMLRNLMQAFVGWRNIDHLADSADSSLTDAKLAAHAIFHRLAATDILGNPIQFKAACKVALSDLSKIEPTSPAAQIVITGTTEAVVCLEAIADCEALLGSEGAPARPNSLSLPFVIDPLPVVVAGARVFIAVLLTSIFWIWTAWSIGQFCIVFAAIATLVFASFGDQALSLAKDYSIGAAIMAVLGGCLYFGILPALTGFPQLLVLLLALLAAIGFMQAGKWHSAMFLAMSVCSLPLLGIGNPPSYSAGNYFNLAMAILAGSTFGTLLFVIFPTVDPSTREHRLIRRTLSSLRQLLLGPLRMSSSRWSRQLSSSVCSLPPTSSDSRFTDLVSISSAGRSARSLMDDLAQTSFVPGLEQAFHCLAYGNLSEAEHRLSEMDQLISNSHAARPDDQNLRIRAQLRVLMDIIRDRGPLLKSGLPDHVNCTL